MKEEMKLKETWKKDFSDYMFLKTNRMFKWENLPETIPEYILERFLQENGKCIFYKYKDDFYIFDFSFSEVPNVYNEPSGIIFTNVALKLTIQEKRNLMNETENGVIILNDTKIKGLKPIFNKYADLLTESEITIKLISQLDRMKTFISASDERTKRESENFLNKIKSGELSVIGDNAIFESVKSFNNGGVNTSVSQYIELMQYLKASCLNEIGINANYNLKRERLNNSEIQLNDFGLLPFCNLMLMQRQKAVEKINEKFNLNIKVSFSDIWEIEKMTLAETLENETNTDNAQELILETENPDSADSGDSNDSGDTVPLNDTENNSDTVPLNDTENNSDTVPLNDTENNSDTVPLNDTKKGGEEDEQRTETNDSEKSGNDEQSENIPESDRLDSENNSEMDSEENKKDEENRNDDIIDSGEKEPDENEPDEKENDEDEKEPEKDSDSDSEEKEPDEVETDSEEKETDSDSGKEPDEEDEEEKENK